MNRRFYIFIISILLINTAFGSSKYFTSLVDLTTGFDQPYSIASISVGLDDKQVLLLLDTGFASRRFDFAISDKIVKKINLKYLNKKTCRMSQSGKTCFDEVAIPRVKIGNKIFLNLPGLVYHGEWGGAVYYKNFNKKGGFDNGLLTLRFLKQFNILFDYKKGFIKFYNLNSTPNDLKNTKKIHFNLTLGNITTQININHHVVNLIWDTAYLPSQLEPNLFLEKQAVTCSAVVYKNFDFGKKIKCLYTKNNKTLNAFIPDGLFVVKRTGLPKFVPIRGIVASDYMNEHEIFIDFKSNIIFVKENNKK